jgi:hypothetical protein
MTITKIERKATIFECASACLCTAVFDGVEVQYATDTLEAAQGWCSRMVGERLLWSSDRAAGVWLGVADD